MGRWITGKQVGVSGHGWVVQYVNMKNGQMGGWMEEMNEQIYGQIYDGWVDGWLMGNFKDRWIRLNI